MKRIGVVCSKNSDGGLGIPSAYAQYFANWGLLIPINALDTSVYDVDLLVLTGGSDVNPERYNKDLSFFTQNSNVQLEYFDTKILPQYIDSNIPIFGICRGFQTLNVHFGGSLKQHIWNETSVKRDDLVHDVIATDYLRQLKYYNVSKFKVNSLHHQGFNVEHCGEMVKPLLLHKDRENVEAFGISGKPIAAVQWHPEEIFDAFSSSTINLLLKQCAF